MSIFVLGSGRSGTHWLGHILDSHPSISAAIEDPRFFRPVVDMALDPRQRATQFGSLVDSYRGEAESVRPQLFADKSHPNIWLAEDLARELPEAMFLGIERSVYGSVASMLKHSGVLSWHDRWREFPVPNAFLGIDVKEQEQYDDLSDVEKCVLRWVSHRGQMRHLRGVLRDRLLVVQYEELITEPMAHTAKMEYFLGLDEPFPPVSPAVGSLDRWRSELTATQIREIDAALQSRQLRS